MKRIAAALAVMMIAAGCADKKGETANTVTEAARENTAQSVQEITVWAPEEAVTLTQDKLEQWLSGSEWDGRYTVAVSPMSEETAASEILRDKDGSADIYSFTQDKLAMLIDAGALSAVEYTDDIKDDTSVYAATSDGRIYAYPETADDGFFLYYDKAVVSDPSTLEGILDDCAAAGKYLYMDIQSAWYDSAFFLAAGAQCRYSYDASGRITDVVCDYSSDKGLTAMRAMTDMHRSPGFAQSTGSDAALFDPDGGTAGAVISGTWDADTVSGLLGSNYGAARLPTFSAGGVQYRMSGTGGFRFIGVKPQDDEDRQRFCHAAANFLAGEQMQTARLEQLGWIPADINAQKADKIQSDPAMKAMTEQLAFCQAQQRFPESYRDIMHDLGKDINSGKYDNASDEELRAALAGLEKDIKDAGKQ